MSNEDFIAAPPEEKHNIRLVTEPSNEWLNPRQVVDYRHHREELAKWVLHLGKDPTHADGYAWSTARRRLSQLDDFYRWVWDREGYTTDISPTHADEYMRWLAMEDDFSPSHKANAQKAVKMLMRYLDHDWEPEIKFTGQYSDMQPREYLSRDERQAVRETALEYGTVPAYGSMTKGERGQWKTLLAQRFRKPYEAIDADDFDRANGFKIPTIVWAGLDAGLRPIEVGRARTYWVDTDNERLDIPAEDASKGFDNWKVPLRSQTTRMLSEWLNERSLYDKYADTDRLWLNREGNPYNADSLGRILRNICEAANIEMENRRISWYAIRHSTGTYMTREEGIVAAAGQLRNSPDTMKKYDQPSEEDRREALDRMG